MPLVIVESPTKARKLRSYLGQEYQIEASVGHVRDLPKGEMGIDVEHNFTPQYVVAEDKTVVVNKLKKLAKAQKQIILATDPDREGEAIAWHLQEILHSVAGVKFGRASFHEITKDAVTKSIQRPGQIIKALVDAQQARRVVDRLVGYETSPVLWKKIRRGLSAGRVQSVALRLLVEREREIEAFKPEEYWEVDVALGTVAGSPKNVFGQSSLPEGSLIARVTQVMGQKFLPKSSADVASLKKFLPRAKYQVTDIQSKERKRESLPPFTTSTLQQSAANRLGYSSKQTMRLAQGLYEEGLITYHRTDSVTLASSAVEAARQYILAQFGPDFLPEKPRYFKNSSKNAQEAHEAIRVTDVQLEAGALAGEGLTSQHVKLYDLIRRRFLASQMSAARYDSTQVTIEASSSGSKENATLTASGSLLKFAGWLSLFSPGDDVILPPLVVDQPLYFWDNQFAQKFTEPPPRYNDASLVKELEKRGIGRPSTYASIISVLELRGYMTRENKRFFVTAIGLTVCDFLLKYFDKFMEYDFTAGMEDDLDAIARGEKEWQKVVGVFYKPFHTQIEKVTQSADRVQIPVEKTGESCPLCGPTDQGEIVIREGRFGKFKSCSRFPDCKFTQNLVENLEGVKCPLCGQGDVAVKKSRWGRTFYGCGRYPDCNWASNKKPNPGEKVTQAEWAQIQAERAERKAAREAKFGASQSHSRVKAKNQGKSVSNSKMAKKTTKKTTKRRKIKTKKSVKK